MPSSVPQVLGWFLDPPTTQIEMEDLLTHAAFVIEQRHTRSNASNRQVGENRDGDYNIAVCREAA